MVKIRDWLKIFRASSSPKTVLSVEIFYLIAGGALLSWFNLWLVLWATLLHWLSYGHNSLMDTARGFDQENPKMKKQPFVAGSVELNTAHNVINLLMIFAVLAGFLIVYMSEYVSRGQPVLALGLLLLYVVTGHAYNDGLDKSTVLSFIPATVSYASLCAASYFLFATSISNLFVLALVYAITAEMFVTGWEGYLKDITFEKERNFLRVMRVRVDKGKFKSSVLGRFFGYGLKIVGIAMLFLSGWIQITLSVQGISTLIILVLVIVFAILLIESRDYNYEHDLIYSVVEDLASILLLIVILAPVVGVVEVISMVSYAIIWFLIFNEITWSSLIKPGY